MTLSDQMKDCYINQSKKPREHLHTRTIPREFDRPADDLVKLTNNERDVEQVDRELGGGCVMYGNVVCDVTVPSSLATYLLSAGVKVKTAGTGLT